jgi:hypothetical protein
LLSTDSAIQGAAMAHSEKEASKQIKQTRELLNQSKELLKQSQKLVRQMQKIIDGAKKPDGS